MLQEFKVRQGNSKTPNLNKIKLIKKKLWGCMPLSLTNSTWKLGKPTTYGSERANWKELETQLQMHVSEKRAGEFIHMIDNWSHLYFLSLGMLSVAL